MNEKEKEAYSFYKKCNVKDLENFDYFSEPSKLQIKYMETVLNLIEKQQAEIEDCKKCVLRDEVHNYIEELEKKDLIINEMAEYIERHSSFNAEMYGAKVEEWKEYFNQKIEKGE